MVQYLYEKILNVLLDAEEVQFSNFLGGQQTIHRYFLGATHSHTIEFLIIKVKRV